MYGPGSHMVGMGWYWLFGVLLVILLVWVIARVASGPGAPGGPPAADESPETLLKRRYARGEIERDEYERRLSDLRR